MSSAIRYELYRRELLRYLSSMTIKFHPFAEIVERYVGNNTNYRIDSYRENPYYRNLVGEYSCIDTEMKVWSIECNSEVTFNRDLWKYYPQTASLYTFGSDAYTRLCLKYPKQVGLIKNIVYPVPDIDVAYNAEEFTILRHEPTFLESNEQESLYTATKQCLNYLKERWYIYDYGNHEDQYFLVFMSQLYMNLFTCLLKQRIENQDTSAVHSLHVWERLDANGLSKYESILAPKQARWFYRNLRYLKANRGRKSNLILLADNLLSGLRVNLVGKRIFQQASDPTQECITVPEFLSEKVVDYSVRITDRS